ncbi:MAG: helix-turn-helix transcriptional regulator [Chloroflexi bacterium]|mgnify:CR=1 FL=1|nr:helix-turn-helix transcriptional regulator [Chloroflexota bacterium]
MLQPSTLDPEIRELKELAVFFSALRDVLRLRILLALASSGELTVTELARTLRVSQPLVSFHLRPLRVLGLVTVRPAGRELYCSIDVEEIQRRLAGFTERLDDAIDVC